MHEDLLEDIVSGPYSLIVDESTDVTSKKQLCIVIRYYSKKLSQIILQHLCRNDTYSSW